MKTLGKKSATFTNLTLYLWFIFSYAFAMNRYLTFNPFNNSFYFRSAWAAGIAYSLLIIFFLFINPKLAKALITIDLTLSLTYTFATLIHPISELPFWIAHLSVFSLFVEIFPEKDILIYHFPKQAWVFGIIFLYIMDLVFILPKLGKDKSN